MKKLFLVCAALCSAFLQASVVTNLQPGLTLVQYDNKYVIQFSMPEHEIGEDTIVANNIEYIFSSIKPYNDYFDHMDEDGRPTLPFYTLHLVMTPSGTWSVTDVQTQTTIEYLDYDYTPAQTHPLFMDVCSYDVSYYNSYDDQWHWDEYEIHETGYGPRRGISFTFFPYHYEPSHRELTIVTEATYEITISNNSLLDYITDISTSDRLSWSLFDNFTTSPITEIPAIDGDEYLIIVDDHWEFETSLIDFVNHKDRLGYNVTVTPLHDIGYSSEDIRTYIRDQYFSCDLKYVLLIGDVDVLPFSAGTEEDDNDPPTDVYYAALDEATISDQDCDITPDVYVGRWPIQTSAQLQNVVNKAMKSDTTLWYYAPNRVSIFTGTGYGQDDFYKDGCYIYNRLVNDFIGYSSELFDGRDPHIGFNSMVNELNGYGEAPPWLFFYRGHGGSNSIGNPYQLCWGDFSNFYVVNNHLDYMPFGFGFACMLGNIFNSENFARSWCNSVNGGVSFYGSTTNSLRTANSNMSRIIFNQLENRPIVTIGEFASNGAAKYYNADCSSLERRNEMKKYVLYGDPSLYIFGLRYPGHIPMLSPQRTENPNKASDILLQKEGFLHINENQFPELQSVNIYSMTGQLLQSGNGYEMNLTGLASGMYIAVIKTNNQQYSQQIITKQQY